MTEYETRTTSIMVLPSRDQIFSEMATTVSIDNDTEGEYVVVERNGRKIRIDPGEWKMLRAAIERMIGECRKPPDIQS